MRILLADDQPEICLLGQQQLESRGHQVVTVANGNEALRVIAEQHFDVVLLDEEMPGMSGTEVLHKLRGPQEREGQCLVIALTGYNTEADKQRLLRAGFDMVLGKPFRFDLLEATLSAITKHHSPQDKHSPPADPQSPPASVLARVGGDEQLLARMAQAFLQDLPTRLDQLDKAIRLQRGDALAFDAHALKGSLVMFGGDKAASLCKNLQECGKAAQFADAARLFAMLKEAIAEMEQNLRRYASPKRTAGPEACAPSKTKRRPTDSN